MNNPMDNWYDWKDTLRKAVDIGEKVGLTDDTMANAGSKIGSLLSHNVDPENKEQRLLKEMWTAANDTEKENMTNVLIKMLRIQ
ncbi:MAG: DUF3243 family protein [Eubacteriales bacterium]